MKHTRTSAFVLAAACSLSACTAKAPAAQASASAPPFHVALDLKQTMNWILEPNAEVIWDAVGTVITEAGAEEFLPETEEEWEAVRNSAAVIAETGNLLMLDGRALDREQWMQFARGMTDAGVVAIKAAEAKDVAGLFDAGGAIYDSCTACHQKYAIELQRVSGAEAVTK